MLEELVIIYFCIFIFALFKYYIASTAMLAIYLDMLSFTLICIRRLSSKIHFFLNTERIDIKNKTYVNLTKEVIIECYC